MFEGTTWCFRFLYFITAMTPAYILFLVQIEYYCFIWYSFIAIPIGLILKHFIIRRVRNREGTGIPKYKIDNILSKNGEITAFLLGVIVPSVLKFSDSVLIQIYCFIGIQFLLLVLMVKSSSIFPNVLMIVLGMNIFELDDGKYIISFSKKIISRQREEVSIRKLGNSEMCMVFVQE